MENDFFYFFLIHWATMAILYKYEISELIHKISVKIGIKFFHEMSQCELCIDHHFGIPVLGILFVLIDFEFEFIYLFYPFMSTGLMNIIKTLKS